VSTSIFKHDITGASIGSSSQAQENSPYIYPTVFRTTHLTGGKPPMGGFRSTSTTATKGINNKNISSSFDNIDPLTGKRRYTRRKKFSYERRDTYEDFNYSGAESDIEVDKQPTKFHLSDNGIWRPTDDLRLIVNLQAVHAFIYSTNYLFQVLMNLMHNVILFFAV
jgi:hypothetical protein